MSEQTAITEGRRSRPRTLRGQTLIEFAVILPVLILLGFGVYEFGRLLQSWVTIQHSAAEAARFAATGSGYASGSGVRESQIIDVARNAATGLFIVDGASSGPGAFVVNVRSSRSGPNPMEADNAGGANDFVRIEVHYTHPFATPIMGMDSLQLDTAVMVINERFARPTGIVGELPPTPPSTWTPIPTPNQTGTAIAGTATAVARLTATAAAGQTATVQAGWTRTPTPVPPTPASTSAARTATSVAQKTGTAAAKTATAAPTPTRTPYP
jgi:hypothetical protein